VPLHRKPVTVALPVAKQPTIDIPPTVVSHSGEAVYRVTMETFALLCDVTAAFCAETVFQYWCLWQDGGSCHGNHVNACDVIAAACTELLTGQYVTTPLRHPTMGGHVTLWYKWSCPMISKANKCTGRNVVCAIRCRLKTYFHSEDYWYYSDGVYEVPESHTQTHTHSDQPQHEGQQTAHECAGIVYIQDCTVWHRYKLLGSELEERLAIRK
jgi:hypothetical protein